MLGACLKETRVNGELYQEKSWDKLVTFELRAIVRLRLQDKLLVHEVDVLLKGSIKSIVL